MTEKNSLRSPSVSSFIYKNWFYFIDTHLKKIDTYSQSNFAAVIAIFSFCFSFFIRKVEAKGAVFYFRQHYYRYIQVQVQLALIGVLFSVFVVVVTDGCLQMKREKCLSASLKTDNVNWIYRSDILQAAAVNILYCSLGILPYIKFS